MNTQERKAGCCLPYKKKIICQECGKSKIMTIINIIPKTCSDECRLARNKKLNDEWKKRNPSRIKLHKETFLKKLEKRKFSCMAPVVEEECLSLLVR